MILDSDANPGYHLNLSTEVVGCLWAGAIYAPFDIGLTIYLLVVHRFSHKCHFRCDVTAKMLQIQRFLEAMSMGRQKEIKNA